MKSFNRIKVLSKTVGDIILKKKLKNVVVADVGCDHGYLSELLSRNENISKIYATDISKKSLDKTKELVKNFNLPKIETKLGDGLDAISRADLVVLAGVGGYEIIKILSNQNITKKGEVKCNYFVLQPTKNFVELRQFLAEKNVKIERDFIVKSGGRFYPIICINLLEKFDSKNDFFDLYFGKSNTLENKDFCEFLFDVKLRLSVLEKISEEKIKNDAILRVKQKILMLANSLIEKIKGD